MPISVKKRSTPSPVALAFSAALAATPALASAAGTMPSSPRAGDDASTPVVPSAAALQRMKALSITMARPGPRWVELWPEVTHVEAVGR